LLFSALALYILTESLLSTYAFFLPRSQIIYIKVAVNSYL